METNQTFTHSNISADNPAIRFPPSITPNPFVLLEGEGKSQFQGLRTNEDKTFFCIDRNRSPDFTTKPTITCQICHRARTTPPESIVGKENSWPGSMNWKIEINNTQRHAFFAQQSNNRIFFLQWKKDVEHRLVCKRKDQLLDWRPLIKASIGDIRVKRGFEPAPFFFSSM